MDEVQESICKKVAGLHQKIPEQCKQLIEAYNAFKENLDTYVFDAALCVYTSHVEILTLLRLYNSLYYDDIFEALQTKYEKTMAEHEGILYETARDMKKFVDYAKTLEQALEVLGE